MVDIKRQFVSSLVLYLLGLACLVSLPGVTSAPHYNSRCVSDCSGLSSGNYQSCLGCAVYVTCTNGYTIDLRPCPAGLVWDDNIKLCSKMSTTCSEDPRPDTTAALEPTTAQQTTHTTNPPTTESLELTTHRPTTIEPTTTPQGMMYIIGKTRTYTFTLQGTTSLELRASHKHSSLVGCYVCAYAVHDQQLYMAGDYDSSREPMTTSTFQPSDTHTPLPSLSASTQGGHFDPFTFILNGRQFVGGFNNKDVYSRSLSNPDSWRTEPDLPGRMIETARSGVVAQGVAYITGGTLDGDYTNTAWSWSPGQAVWQQLPSMTHTHNSHCNTLINDTDIYVLGGFVDHGPGARGHKAIEVYNIPTKTWSLRSPAPYELTNAPSCASVGSYIYAHNYKKLYRYDTTHDTWTLLGSINDDMWGSSMLIV